MLYSNRIGSDSYLELKLRWSKQNWKLIEMKKIKLNMTSKYLKLYISTTTDLIFLKFKIYAEGTKPKFNIDWNEVDLEWKMTLNKNLKVEYFCNHLSDLPQILNLRWGNKPKMNITWNESNFQWKLKPGLNQEMYRKSNRKS